MKKVFRVTQFDPATVFNLVNKAIADANSGKINLTLADIKGHLVVACNEYPTLYKDVATIYDETTLTVLHTGEGNRTMLYVEMLEVVGELQTPEE